VTSATRIDYTVEQIDVRDRNAVVLAYESAWAGDGEPPVEIGARYHWLYAGNPAGHAELLGLRTSSGQSVGMLAVVPRRFWVDDTPFTLGLLCDFIVHRGHRTLMPALLLQRAAREVADRIGSGTYAIPNDKSLPVIHRLGGNVVRRRPRFARVMRSHYYFVRRSATLARIASRPMDAAAAAWDFVVANLRPWLHAEWLTAFDDRFDDLWRRTQRTNCIGERSSEYLSWRFGKEPGGHNETLGVFDRRTGVLMAYSVGSRTGRTFEMRDFLCCLDSTGQMVCLALMMRHIRRLDIDSVSFRLYSEQNLAACFNRMGFRAREFESVFFHSRLPDSRLPNLLTRADEDV
jgi:hypothetical protein